MNQLHSLLAGKRGLSWVKPLDCPSEIVGDLHNEREELRTLIADIKAWDVSQFVSIPHDLRVRIEDALTYSVMTRKE